MMSFDGKKRCFGHKTTLYATYHDEEWGVASHDDRYLFEMLILEGAQAGLSWETVLNKREGYRAAFYHFDIHKIANMDNDMLQALYNNAAIIRNKLKIHSVPINARIALQIQQEYGSLDAYFWGFCNHKIIDNKPASFADVPVSTSISDSISKDLKKRGMKFVGTTIIYAYMQAIGMVNDHVADCHIRKGKMHP